METLPLLNLFSELFNRMYAAWLHFQRLPIRYRLQALLYLWFYYLGAFATAYIAGIAYVFEKAKQWLIHSKAGRYIGEEWLEKIWITEEKIPVLHSDRKRTVLVTGAVHGKGLHTVRILGRAGHKVIVADSKEHR